jgi:glycosyltransferase involved in cell wall biosynthesis
MTPPARIGIDGRRLGPNLKGIGRYVWELCRGLDRILPAAQFFLYSPTPTDLAPISRRWSIRVEDSEWWRRLPNNLWLVARAGMFSRRDNLDVFWAGTGLLPLVGLNVRKVLTIHDVVHRVAPETMDWRALWAARLFFNKSLAGADAIVTNSTGTAARLSASFGYQAAAVVRPGLSEDFHQHSTVQIKAVLMRFGLSRPYFLAVSTWEPRKGLGALIRVFLRMKAEGWMPNHKLVLVGERGWKDSSIIELVRGSDSVVSLGYVDNAPLAALYSGADVFIYPSTYEGFGMPVLEARACGARVVTSNLPELREAGGDEAIYIAPNESGIRSGLIQALKTDSSAPVDWRNWSWDESAAVLARVLLGHTNSESQIAS